jgi:predicted phosphodiesterase
MKNSPKTMDELILYDLKKKGLTYEIFLDKYEMDKTTAKQYVRDLVNRGYKITTINKDYELYFRLDTVTQEARKVKSITTENIYKFGAISDTHLNSKEEKSDELQIIYDEFVEDGITDVYHAGDLGDGFGIYPDQEFYLKNVSTDDQLEYIVQNYPYRKGITTHYVGGNHDAGVTKKVGFDYCPVISSKRSDLDYLGQTGAIVMINDLFKMEIEHFQASMAKGISYRGYRFLEDYVGPHPDLALFGHKHTSGFYTLSNTMFMELGCFQGLTPWAKTKKFSEHIGGYIITIVQNSNSHIKIIPEWIGF